MVTFENAKFALEAAKNPKKRIDNRVKGSGPYCKVYCYGCIV